MFGSTILNLNGTKKINDLLLASVSQKRNYNYRSRNNESIHIYDQKQRENVISKKV